MLAKGTEAKDRASLRTKPRRGGGGPPLSSRRQLLLGCSDSCHTMAALFDLLHVLGKISRRQQALSASAWGCRAKSVRPAGPACRRLEEAFEAEVARQGGVHSARPKAVLDALQPLFPELGLQVQNIKWWANAAPAPAPALRVRRGMQLAATLSSVLSMYNGGCSRHRARGRQHTRPMLCFPLGSCRPRPTCHQTCAGICRRTASGRTRPGSGLPPQRGRCGGLAGGAALLRRGLKGPCLRGLQHRLPARPSPPQPALARCMQAEAGIHAGDGGAGRAAGGTPQAAVGGAAGRVPNADESGGPGGWRAGRAGGRSPADLLWAAHRLCVTTLPAHHLQEPAELLWAARGPLSLRVPAPMLAQLAAMPAPHTPPCRTASGTCRRSARSRSLGRTSREGRSLGQRRSGAPGWGLPHAAPPPRASGWEPAGAPVAPCMPLMT